MSCPTRNILGVPIAAANMESAMRVIDNAIRSRNPLQIGVVNAAKIVNMQIDPELADSVLSSDIIFADGMSVVWASRLLRRPLPERVAGIDLMFRMLEMADRNGYRVYLLGARPEIVSEVARRIGTDYPNAVVAGFRDGYFHPEEEQQIASEICDSKADMLFVAITSPKKEKFLAQWEARMSVPVCHGVGGSFDVYAGFVSRAPMLWQKLGLEWLYRTLQEPKRLWKRYLYTNSAFVWMTLKACFRPSVNDPKPRSDA